MTGPTWNDGQLEDSDVIEDSYGIGYTSMSDFVDGDNGYQPDPVDDSDQ